MSDTPKNKKENGLFAKISSWFKNVQWTESKQQATAICSDQFTQTMKAVTKRLSANDPQQSNGGTTSKTLCFSNLTDKPKVTTAVAEVNSPQVKPTIH